MTGAPLPDGADPVVMVEDTVTDAGHVVANTTTEHNPVRSATGACTAPSGPPPGSSPSRHELMSS